MARADMRLWVALGAAAILVGGCSRADAGGSEQARQPTAPKGLTPCEEIYGADKVIDAETFGQACAQGEDLVVPRPVRLECSDGRQLYWNQFAWGYLTEPMTLIDRDAPDHQPVPVDEAVECIQATVADTQALIRQEMNIAEDDDLESVVTP